jgi:MFS family permease
VAWFCILMLTLGAFLASVGTGGLVSIIAAVSPPRIRSQAFAAFGLALAVCGAAFAPAVVGAASDLLQYYTDMSNGETLRWSMLGATTAVMTIGTWFAWESSKSAAADAQKTMGDFLAEFQAQAQAEASASE